MRIEEYLKNSPIVAIFHAQQALNQQLQKALVSEQVNFLQCLTLITILLEGHRHISPSQLVGSFGCSKARMSQMLTYLEAQGWLCRTITHDDARRHTLSLTSDGMTKANRLIKCMDALEHDIEKTLDARALQALTGQLRSLAAAGRA